MPDIHPTWNDRAIITDTAYLPYTHCAFLDGEQHGIIGYGRSEEQAVEHLIEQLEDAARPRCPECDSANVTIEAYDFGTDRETGYNDSGEMLACHNCGAREPQESQLAEIAPRKPAASAKPAMPEAVA